MLKHARLAKLSIAADSLEVDPTIVAQLEAKFAQFFSDIKHNGGDYIWNLIEIVFIFIAAKFILRFISYLTKRIMESKKYHKTEYGGKRIDSIMTVFRSAARYLIYFVACFMALDRIGLKDTGGLLLTAGVGGVAIGFGAQSLVKDVVIGFFLMFENQFSVGDFVKIEGVEGYVDAIAIRVTYVRAYTGEKIIIPNGSIGNVINYSRGAQLAKVAVPVAYEYPLNQIIENMNYALDVFTKKNAAIIVEPARVQGIDSFENTHLVVNVICKVLALKHWEAQRELRMAIKEQFDAVGIKFPFPFVVQVEPEEKRLPSHGAKPNLGDSLETPEQGKQ